MDNGVFFGMGKWVSEGDLVRHNDLFSKSKLEENLKTNFQACWIDTLSVHYIMPVTRSMAKLMDIVTVSIPFYTLFNSYEVEHEKIMDYFSFNRYLLYNHNIPFRSVEIEFQMENNNFLDFNFQIKGTVYDVVKYLYSYKSHVIELVTAQTIQKINQEQAIFQSNFEEPVHNTITMDRFSQLITPVDPILNETCRICLDDLNEKTVKVSCGHCFHQECISNYLTSKCIHPVCPICRFDLH